MGKTVAYLRVSTDGQDLEKNKTAILRFANDKGLGRVHWVEEKVTGTRHWRDRGLGQLVKGFKRGDKLVVSELSRLGRSTMKRKGQGWPMCATG